MTKRQREALKLAMVYLKRAEADKYNDWDMAKRQSKMNYYTGAQVSAMEAQYREIVAALQVIDEMLRGVQTEMKI